MPLGHDSARQQSDDGHLPQSGFEDTQICVPGYWNTFPDAVGGDWGAYDHYAYPKHWQDATTAWYRRRFRTEVSGAGSNTTRTRVVFEAVAGKATVWLNGRQLGENVDSFLPFAFDVTGILRPNEDNELLVRVEPPPTCGGLWLQPCGSWVGWYLRGVWQPVYLETTPLATVEDIFVQPSVRNAKLTVDVTIESISPVKDAQLRLVVLERGKRVLDLGTRSVDLGEKRQTTLRFDTDDPPLALWSPDSPQLNEARAELLVHGKVLHTREVRFGFREFWIDGTGFRLNGKPIRLFGDSWHYMGPAQQNPAHARTWFEFARSTGVNVIRTHAMPYPPLYFDLADELGMMIIDESAIYGSAGTLAYEEEAFWQRSRDHIQRLVRRDRNHPSIIFWSACNETVWKGGEGIHPQLLSLGKEARQLDSTRFVSYDENDCDLGGGSPVHAGHYGTPSHWDRSWKRNKPLTVHEFCSLYHGGPESVCQIGNDRVYTDYLARLQAAGEDAADMFLRLRSLGAASITPWNLIWYCLEPIPARDVNGIPASLTQGGALIQRIGARALTLNYGFSPGEPRWQPNPAYEPLATCYRRQRFFIRRRPRQAFGGTLLQLSSEIWNDQDNETAMELVLRLRPEDGEEIRLVHPVALGACASTTATLTARLPDVAAHEAFSADLTLSDIHGGEPLHSESWALHVHPAESTGGKSDRKGFVLGDDLPDHAVSSLALHRVTEAKLSDTVLSAPCGSLILVSQSDRRTLRDWLSMEGVEDWVRGGGRLIVLPAAFADDETSALSPVHKTFDHAYRRDNASGLLDGLTNEHFREWGEDGVVARCAFERPTTGPAIAPLDVGDPSEGLACAPLVIVPHGLGHVVVSGIDLLEHAADTPAAAILLARLVHHGLPASGSNAASVIADAQHPLGGFLDEVGVADTEESDILLCAGDAPVAIEDSRASRQHIDSVLARGGTVFVSGITPETATDWSERLGVRLRLQPDTRFSVARVDDSPLFAGLNNFDLCWVKRDVKQPIVRHTLDIDPAAYRTLVETVATRWEDYQAAAEQHKVAMMVRRMESFAGPRAAVIEIRRGPGRIIVSQLLLQEGRNLFRDRARRIMSRWLDNFGAARDPRVSPLAARERRILHPAGFITEWLILGPFSEPEGHPLDHPFVDEASLQPREGQAGGGRTWRRVSSALPQIDLAELFDEMPPTDRVAYAGVYVHSARDRSVLLDEPDMIALLTGADGGTKPMLNGEPLGRFDFVRELVLDSDRVDGLPLRKGWNTLILKLHNPSGPWQFAARLVSSSGEPATELDYQVQPPT